MENIEAGTVDIKIRQDVTRTVVHRVVATYGHYPSKEVRMKVASLLAEILGLQRHLFYDDVTHEGFLQRGLQNARRRLPGMNKASAACLLCTFLGQ